MFSVAQVNILRDEGTHCLSGMSRDRSAFSRGCIDLSKTLHLRLRNLKGTMLDTEFGAVCLANVADKLHKQGLVTSKTLYECI